MKKFTVGFVLFIAMAGLATIAACTDVAEPIAVSQSPASTPPAVHPPDGHDAPRISLAQAKKAFDDGTATFIDTHVKATYDAGHIPGAINVTMQELEEKFNSIPKGERIIAYCS
jgi:3-mercaptopyruvate sulfurtransferase SseA